MKPDDITQSAWDAAYLLLVGRVNLELADQPWLARAIDAAKAEAYGEAMRVAGEYAQVSSLHNYGAGGLSRDEQAVIRTAKFIVEDIRALATALVTP